jgi:hypothetical protein
MSIEEYKKEYKEKGKKIATDITHIANSSYEKDVIEGFVEQSRKEHRTLQESTMRVFVKLFEKWSEDYENGRYDLRNEATVRVSHKIYEEIKNEAFPFI